MKLQLSRLEDFGPQLGDGAMAAEYRSGRIDSYVEVFDEIVLDFSGVRTANSSFINALVVGFVEHHGEHVLRKLIFKGCNPVLHVLVESATDLSLQKIEGRVGARSRLDAISAAASPCMKETADLPNAGVSDPPARLVPLNLPSGDVDEEALSNLWRKGREAWRSVPSATDWVEEMRGSVGA